MKKILAELDYLVYVSWRGPTLLSNHHRFHERPENDVLKMTRECSLKGRFESKPFEASDKIQCSKQA